MAKSSKANKSDANIKALPGSAIDLDRLVAKVAWMYHVRNLSQGEIAKRFNNAFYGPQDFALLASKTHET